MLNFYVVVTVNFDLSVYQETHFHDGIWVLIENDWWVIEILYLNYVMIQHVNIAANVNMAFSASISSIPHPTPKKEQKDVVSVFVESD